MGGELKEKDPAWVPRTPAKRDSSRTVRDRTRKVSSESLHSRGKLENKNGGISDNLKMKGIDDVDASSRMPHKRMRMKRHRPKVFDESKAQTHSTPKPRKPKPARYVKKKVEPSKDDSGEAARDCRKLRSSNRVTSLIVYGTVESLKIFKKRRTRRKRMSLDKLIRLVGIIHEKSMCKCVSTILNLTWMNMKRRRSRTLTPRQDLSFFLLATQHTAAEKSVEHCKHVVSDNGNVLNCSAESGDCTLRAEMDILKHNLQFDMSFHQQEDIMCKCMDLRNEPENALPIQVSDDAYKEALVDFATQKMESLHLVVKDPKHHKPKVDLDEETMRVWNLLMEKNGDGATKEKENDKKDDNKAAYLEKEKELFGGRVDSFIAVMFLLLGDRRFSRWKGSVVDSVVGVFLTQNVSDNLSSNAFMALAARYPLPSESEQNGCDGRIDYMTYETQQVETHEPLSGKSEESNPNNHVEVDVENENKTLATTEATSTSEKGKVKHEQENPISWDDLRKNSPNISAKREDHSTNSVNWEAVRQASARELAKVIEERGMSNQLAGRIKNFLDRLVRDHGSIDLEWLRNVPPDKAKDYLMSIDGLGLKSTECVRLLSLHQRAFPIDVNVGRVVVRLGWAKLQPLPDGLPLHLLNDYPELGSVQKYIWPRICNRDELTLYELHCYLNVFSKAFCTKTQPNCNACPMRGECKHYASALASSRLHLEGSVSSRVPSKEAKPMLRNSDSDGYNSLPIIEFPASPEPTSTEPLGGDIEDFGFEFEIPTIILNSKKLLENSPSFVDDDVDVSKAVVALNPQVASIHMPKLKYEERLRTVHLVFELPDSHPLLTGFEKREPEDPCPYLLAIWTTDSSQEPKKACNCEGQGSTTCGVGTCCSREIVDYQKDKKVEGTILIPCRTANRGRFPLNGTYFQINEVFADHESSRQPIDVPRGWIWNLKERTLYCGTSITSICRGMSLEQIARCFQKGYICIRGFDVKTRGPRSLSNRFHVCKTRQSANA